MAKFSRVAGATSQSVNIFIQNSSVTTGAGLTGLVFNTSSLTAYYTFTGTNTAATAITLATLAAANSAYSSGGFKEIDATNLPGVYRLDLPDACLATSKGNTVLVMLKGATNMAPCVLEIELTGWDNQDAVHGGMSCLPNTAVTTNGSLITSGTGTAQLSVASGLVSLASSQTFNMTGNITGNLSGSIGSVTARVTANTDQLAGQTVTAAAGVTFPTSVASPTNITAGTITTVTNLTNAPTAGDFTAAMKSSLNAATPASVGSVTAAVTVSGTSALTEAYAAPKAGLTLASALYGINQMLEEFSIGGTTTTVKKRDQSTTAMTFTLNDATAPTAVTQAT